MKMFNLKNIIKMLNYCFMNQKDQYYDFNLVQIFETLVELKNIFLATILW